MCHIRRATSVIESSCVLWEEKLCNVRKSHLWYEERKCVVHGGSHLQYDQKVVQCEESVQYQKGCICSRRTGCVV